MNSGTSTKLVDVVYRGIDGTVPAIHTSGSSIDYLTPDTTYAINLTTYEKGQFAYPAEATSGGIQGINIVPQIQSVYALDGLNPAKYNGRNYYSGIVQVYDPIRAAFASQEYVWLTERSNAAVKINRIYAGQYAGPSNIIGPAETTFPIYLVTEPTSNPGPPPPVPAGPGVLGQAYEEPNPPFGPRRIIDFNTLAGALQLPFNTLASGLLNISLADDALNDRLKYTLNPKGIYHRTTTASPGNPTVLMPPGPNIGPERRINWSAPPQIPQGAAAVAISVIDDPVNEEVIVSALVTAIPPNVLVPGPDYAVLGYDIAGVDPIRFRDDPQVVFLTARQEISIGVQQLLNGLATWFNAGNNKQFTVAAGATQDNQTMLWPIFKPKIGSFLYVPIAPGVDGIYNTQWQQLSIESASPPAVPLPGPFTPWTNIQFANDVFQIYNVATPPLPSPFIDFIQGPPNSVWTMPPGAGARPKWVQSFPLSDPCLDANSFFAQVPQFDITKQQVLGHFAGNAGVSCLAWFDVDVCSG